MIQVVTSALPPSGVRLAAAAARLAEGCRGYRSVTGQFGSALEDLSGALEGYEVRLTATLEGQAGALAALGLALLAAGFAYADADARAILPGLPGPGLCPVPGAPATVPLVPLLSAGGVPSGGGPSAGASLFHGFDTLPESR